MAHLDKVINSKAIIKGNEPIVDVKWRLKRSIFDTIFRRRTRKFIHKLYAKRNSIWWSVSDGYVQCEGFELDSLRDIDVSECTFKDKNLKRIDARINKELKKTISSFDDSKVEEFKFHDNGIIITLKSNGVSSRYFYLDHKHIYKLPELSPVNSKHLHNKVFKEYIKYAISKRGEENFHCGSFSLFDAENLHVDTMAERPDYTFHPKRKRGAIDFNTSKLSPLEFYNLKNDLNERITVIKHSIYYFTLNKQDEIEEIKYNSDISKAIEESINRYNNLASIRDSLAQSDELLGPEDNLVKDIVL